MQLLETPDNELWDMLSGRSEPDDASLRPLVQRLRSC
jgi:succinate dehydrogenase flavin-adding protein (antitoxin of CptAB toxin-antitoxin module)